MRNTRTTIPVLTGSSWGSTESHPTNCRFLRFVAFVVQNFRPRCRGKLCLARRQTRRAGRTRSPCWIELGFDGVSPYQLSLFALGGLCRAEFSTALPGEAVFGETPNTARGTHALPVLDRVGVRRNLTLPVVAFCASWPWWCRIFDRAAGRSCVWRDAKHGARDARAPRAGSSWGSTESHPTDGTNPSP